MTGLEETIAATSTRSSLDSVAARARGGNSEAIDELLRATRPLVFRWAYVRTANADDAEDVTQTVLIRVHQRLSDFQGRSSYTSWLYRITANAAGELHRSRGVLQRLRTRLRGLARPTSMEPDLARVIDDRRTRDLIHAMVAGLPERQRTALDLIDLQGFTPAEAAEMESVNASTMRVHLLRARRAVRRRILDSAAEGTGDAA